MGYLENVLHTPRWEVFSTYDYERKLALDEEIELHLYSYIAARSYV